MSTKKTKTETETQIYSFAWKNREIPKGTLLILLHTGKLNSVHVQAIATGKEWITDRRALRKAFVM